VKAAESGRGRLLEVGVVEPLTSRSGCRVQASRNRDSTLRARRRPDLCGVVKAPRRGERIAHRSRPRISDSPSAGPLPDDGISVVRVQLRPSGHHQVGDARGRNARNGLAPQTQGRCRRASATNRRHRDMRSSRSERAPAAFSAHKCGPPPRHGDPPGLGLRPGTARASSWALSRGSDHGRRRAFGRKLPTHRGASRVTERGT
jgi:hypothetical protein